MLFTVVIIVHKDKIKQKQTTINVIIDKSNETSKYSHEIKINN